MVYGYIRVSTAGQRNGNSLESQKEALEAAGVTEFYQDVFTSMTPQRPGFSELLSVLNPGDTLVVTSLDCFARSVSQVSTIITELIDKRITINVLNLGTLNNDSVSPLMRNMILSFGQFEKTIVGERIREGKEIARQKKGYREGRPRKFSAAQIEHALDMLCTDSYKIVEQKTGISKSTLKRAIKEDRERCRAQGALTRFELYRNQHTVSNN